MELICPDCRADLVVVDAQNATCAGHNGRYQILFDRSLGAAQPGTETAAASPEPTVRIGDSQVEAPQAGNVRCRQHPEVQAVARCRVCHAGVCATCDFLLPGNLHVCPGCLESEPSTDVSPRRRHLAIGAIIIAVFTLMMYVLSMSGAFRREFGGSEAANMVLGNLMLWPAIAGMVMSLSSFDRRLGNSALIWTAVVWNAIDVGIFVLFMIIGLMMH